MLYSHSVDSKWKDDADVAIAMSSARYGELYDPSAGKADARAEVACANDVSDVTGCSS